MLLRLWYTRNLWVPTIIIWDVIFHDYIELVDEFLSLKYVWFVYNIDRFFQILGTEYMDVNQLEISIPRINKKPCVDRNLKLKTIFNYLRNILLQENMFLDITQRNTKYFI